ncbi:MAG: haloacid dehalogenase [Anaerolineae bacterium]|nr:haloacid dehalogenase [Anaerolineae bacterium]MDW8068769.1 haloacid dehalogenase [Anaerolineae bacterium]
MERLEALGEEIRADLSARDAARDEALRRSRELVRLCATAIRAVHREEWGTARELLDQADEVAAEMVEAVTAYPDLLYAGYVQDGLKERAEAHLVLAMVTGAPLPDPAGLGVSSAVYLNGLCEAASELRRRCLDLLRQDRLPEAERLLSVMEAVYDLLMTYDFPDVVTGGLRHRVDQLRGVLERTRGDVTQALLQGRLLAALRPEGSIQHPGEEHRPLRD